MKFGASMFFTDYSTAPAELAVAKERRGFGIVPAPEHAHIPDKRPRSGIARYFHWRAKAGCQPDQSVTGCGCEPSVMQSWNRTKHS
jgi:hypothetical protein